MKVEVTEGMESVAWDAHQTMKEKLEAALAHPDCQRQIRDLVLAAVPGERSGATNQIDRFGQEQFNACRAETIAHINALFEKESEHDH